MREFEDAKYKKKRQIFGGISLLLFLIVIALLTWLFVKVLAPYIGSTEELHQFLETFGWTGRFILLGLQILQVVIAFIPGEIIELGAGYAYGAVEGTLLCLAGVTIASSILFLLTKKLGVKLVELFISRENIQQLRFINSEKKLKRLIFLLFLIPGTPKDILTYFVGLTNITLSQFLWISLIARIPSIVSSTISGHLLGEENYMTAIIVYAITGALSVIGYFVYNKVVQARQNQRKIDDK